MPITLATCETEIRRITVIGQLGQESSQDPISMEKSWAWWCVPVVPETAKSIK
jgi:hypothetical protein